MMSTVLYPNNDDLVVVHYTTVLCTCCSAIAGVIAIAPV